MATPVLERPQSLLPAGASSSGERIRTLDGLRAVSISLVLLGHFANNRQIPPLISQAMDFANFGVRVFFVISGFLITSLLLKEHHRHGRISLKNFYLRRVFRIFPAFYAYFFVILAGSLAGLLVVKRADFAAAAFYVMNFRIRPSWYLGHLWSLSVEEQFYFLWPWVIALAGWRWAARSAIAVFCLAPFLRIAIFYLMPSYRPAIGSMFPTVADALAIGCLLGVYRDVLWQRRWYRCLLESKWFFLVPVLAFAANKLGGSVRFYLLFLVTGMNLAVAISIDWSMRNADSRIGRMLELRPVVFLGIISYSLYLWQQPFFDYRDNVGGSAAVRLACSVSAALASYYIIEKPCMRLRHRLFPLA